jgi:hypothetical protein
MKDCKTQEQKDELMREMFYQYGLSVDKTYSYKNSKDKIPFKVIDKNNSYYGLCGKILWNNFYKRKKWGFRCLNEDDKNKFIDSQFIQIGIKRTGNYTNADKPIKFIVIDQRSRLYGLTGKIRLSNILSGKRWGIQSLDKKSFEIYVNKMAKELGYTIIKYPYNTQDKIIYTNKNGHTYTQLFTNFIKRNGRRDSKIPFGEAVILEILKINNIKYEYQKTIYHKDGSHQFMDFYLPDYNMCIEYNGRQHYEKTSITNLQHQQKQDFKKYKYCESKKIKYNEIPFIYDSIKKITEYISQKILYMYLSYPNRSDIQYSTVYDEKYVISMYKKYKSSVLVGKKLNINAASICRILEINGIDRYSQKKKVVQINNNMVRHIYCSMNAAGIIISKNNNGNGSNIAAACNEKIQHAYGYRWMYLEDYRKLHPEFTDEDVQKYIVTEQTKLLHNT